MARSEGDPLPEAWGGAGASVAVIPAETPGDTWVVAIGDPCCIQTVRVPA